MWILELKGLSIDTLGIVSIRKGKRFVSKQGQRQPHAPKKARILSSLL